MGTERRRVACGVTGSGCGVLPSSGPGSRGQLYGIERCGEGSEGTGPREWAADAGGGGLGATAGRDPASERGGSHVPRGSVRIGRETLCGSGVRRSDGRRGAGPTGPGVSGETGSMSDSRWFGWKGPRECPPRGAHPLAQRADRGRSRGRKRDSGPGRSWRSGLSAAYRARMVFCALGVTGLE